MGSVVSSVATSILLTIFYMGIAILFCFSVASLCGGMLIVGTLGFIVPFIFFVSLDEEINKNIEQDNSP